MKEEKRNGDVIGYKIQEKEGRKMSLLAHPTKNSISHLIIHVILF